MKKIIAILVAASILSACGSPMTVRDKTYPTYGFFNSETKKSEKMCYEVSIGNVFWSVLLVETIVAPFYFLGFSLWEPVSEKKEGSSCGIDA
jgi:hypothetical protein